MRDYAVAISDLNEAISIDPNSQYSPFRARADTKIRLNDNLGAIDDLNQAISLDPYKSVNYFNRGLAKERLDDYRASLSDYTASINLDSTKALTYFNRGKLRNRSGLGKDGACLDFSKAGA